MAAIAAANVTTTIVALDRTERGKRLNSVTIVFGNGALTYPAGGVPLTASAMGCPTQLQNLLLSDASNADGYVYKWDSVNNKIRIYQGAASVSLPLLELTGSATPAATTLQALVIGY